MYESDCLIGEIHITSWKGNNSYVSPIYGWKDYGVVCPTECTSNGKAYIVASVIWGKYYEMTHDLKDTSFSVECWIDGQNWAGRKEEEICEKLIKKFYQCFPK